MRSTLKALLVVAVVALLLPGFSLAETKGHGRDDRTMKVNRTGKDGDAARYSVWGPDYKAPWEAKKAPRNDSDVAKPINYPPPSNKDVAKPINYRQAPPVYRSKPCRDCSPSVPNARLY